MQENIILKISEKIREKRKSSGTTIQELADRAKVSKGLISQIENSRTVPSLPVLVNIIQSLDIDLNDFFKGIETTGQSSKVLLKKVKDYDHFEKENAKGFLYKRIMSKDINNVPIDIVLLELKKGAKRPAQVKTEAFEYKFVIKGKVKYVIDGQEYLMEEGDSIFFDGRLGHKLSNTGDQDALILVMYFFTADNEKI